MANDVSEYCKRCDTCQRVNNRLGRARAELHPIPVTDVWKQIGIDLIGMLIEIPLYMTVLLAFGPLPFLILFALPYIYMYEICRCVVLINIIIHNSIV